MFSSEIFENFKSTYSEEHLGTTASECLRKISPLLVLEKVVLDGKRHNGATNAFYWKYESHEVSFAAQKMKKSLMENFIFCAVFVQYSRYFYPHGISSPENTPRPGVLTHLGH